MTVSAPITQDVLTLPRKLSEGPVNLIGLSRSALVQTLIDCGLAEKKPRCAAVRSGSGSIKKAFGRLIR